MKALQNNISRKEQKEMINAYILENISDDHIIFGCDKDKVNFVWRCFETQSNPHITNHQQRLAYWFSGLPSCINIAFNYCDILELAEKWGSDVSTEKKQDDICANWFNYMACKFIQLREKLNK